MAIDFPASPSVNQEVSQGNMIWFWNGTYWEIRSSTSKFTAGDSPPSSYTAGDFWYESDTGNLLVYYSDANTSQWVEIGHAADSSVVEYAANIDGGVPSSNYTGISAFDGGAV